MKKVSKDKSRVTITEYTISQIDSDGEVVDVLDHKDTKAEAVEAARRYVGDEVLAVVVEKVITRHPMHLHRDPRTWDVVFTIGDKNALRAGDWV